MSKFKLKTVLLLLLLSAMGGVLPVYSGNLYAQTDIRTFVTNHISTGDVNIRIREFAMINGKEVPYETHQTVLPGDTISKIPRIENLAASCWIRVKITFSGQSESLSGLSPSDIGGMNKDEWIKIGDYYYLLKPLEERGSIDLFREVHIPGDWTEAYADRTFAIHIRADAIQESHFQPDFEAMSPWGDEMIELCVHEEENLVISRESDVRFNVVFRNGAEKLVAGPDNFFQNMPALMPGDRITDYVTIRNTSDVQKEIRFYTALPTPAEDQLDMLEKLQLRITLGEKTIYEGNLKADPLNTGTSLGKFAPGDEGKMEFTLYMPEGLQNAYALRNADVRWIFETDPDPAVTSVPQGGGNYPVTSDYTPKGTSPVKTGDPLKPGVFAGILGGAVMVMLSVLLIRKRRSVHEA